MCKKGKFMLCVPKMQIVLVPIQRKIKFNMRPAGISMPSIFCILKFLLIRVYLRSGIRFVAVVIQFLIPLCYIRSAVVLLGLPAFAFLFLILSLSTVVISDANFYSQRRCFGLFKGMHLSCTLISTHSLYFLVG